MDQGVGRWFTALLDRGEVIIPPVFPPPFPSFSQSLTLTAALGIELLYR